MDKALEDVKHVKWYVNRIRCESKDNINNKDDCHEASYNNIYDK